MRPDGTVEPPELPWLAGGGEMGERMRTKDWSATPLGAPDGWPRSVKTAVSICLNSSFPILLWLGPELRIVYNDAYIPFFGERKHPAMLGAPGREAWGEVWPTIGPLHDEVAAGRSISIEHLLVFFARRLPREEVYVTFGYSPIFAEDGRSIEGVFCACTETTDKIVGERRLTTLRDLGTCSPGRRSAESACAGAAAALEGNPSDIPFAAIYLLDEPGTTAHLVAGTRLPDDRAAFGQRYSLAAAGLPWPLADVAASGRGSEVRDLPNTIGVFPAGLWPEPVETAFVLPLRAQAQERAAGFLIVGVSPRRVLNLDYRSFLDLVAGHIATGIADARAYEEQRRRAEALATLDRAKTTFFANVSHEFRTPLTLLIGPIEELLAEEGGRLLAADRDLLIVAHRNSLRLLRLVNTLLDFSRVEAGRMQATYEPVELAAITADLAANFRSACERAGLAFEVDCPPLDEPVYVDREMWEKIVLNLLSNAFKFSKRGRIGVRIRADGGTARLTVSDTGIGIAPPELPRIFERFHRVEGQDGRTHEGTGIGLALVQELVRLHGGEIGVESTIGRGTTFTVTIPLGRAHLAPDRISVPRSMASTAIGANAFVEEALRWLAPAGLASPATGTTMDDDLRPALMTSTVGTKRARILVADDNSDMRDYLRRLLSAWWDVEAVGDGQAALDAVRRNKPDLVLADIMMPCLNGIELLLALRRDPELHDLPIALVSARAGEEARLEALHAGANDYLVKPFSERELVARIESQLMLSRLRADQLASMSRLHELSARLTATSDLSALLHEVLDAVMELQRADFGDVQLYDKETRTLRIVAQRGFGPDLLEHFRAVDANTGSTCGRALRHQTRVIVEDVMVDADFAPHRPLAVAAGFRAAQSTPLFERNGGGLVGMLTTHFRQAHRPPARDLRLTDLYAQQAADIIAFRLTEQRLRASEARLQAAIDLVGLSPYSWDPKTNALVWDARLRAIWSLPSDVAADMEWFRRGVRPEDWPRVEAAIAACADPSGDGLYDVEYRVIGIEDGVERWVSTRGRTFFEDGAAAGFAGVALDITARKRAEQRLQDSEARLAAILEQLPQGVGLFDREGRLTRSNAALRRFMDGDIFPSIDSHGRRRWRAFNPDGTMLAPRDYPGARALRGETIAPGIDFLHTDENGREIWARLSAAPFRDERGEIAGAVMVVQDIDAEKRAAQTNLLLIGELQHRTRNLLAVIDSLAGETVRSSRSLDEFAATFSSRLATLSRVQGLLSRVETTVTMGELVELELRALGAEPDGQRIVLTGPEIVLPNEAVQILALALHELATNARKHGALGPSEGTLRVSWSLAGVDEAPRLALEWEESGALPELAPGARPRRGFGWTLIEESLPFQLDAQTRLELGPRGVRCSLSIPLPRRAARAGHDRA